ncbi:hypothetical protein [Halomontanus rarus]|uniref:hypothetical protein n=1 Tax=Halomontanus rarus TaxID=3034020 RepID=UPI0023E89A1C|nr:hypothetical protein [Halovivax sp. TS33]
MRTTIDLEVDRSAGPRLEQIRPGTILRCRNPEEGDLCWYFALEGGDVVRYHELADYERSRVSRMVAAAIVGHPEVQTAVLPERYLEYARGEV